MKKILLVIFILLFTSAAFADWQVAVYGNRRMRVFLEDATIDADGNTDYNPGPVHSVVFQVFGTFTGEVMVYGSIDGTNWQALHDEALTTAGWVTVVDEDWPHYRVTVASLSAGEVELQVIAR